jgi:hypothetical protein
MTDPIGLRAIETGRRVPRLDLGAPAFRALEHRSTYTGLTRNEESMGRDSKLALPLESKT